MSAVPKSQVLQSFKQLHKTCKRIFKGDDQALNAARIKINDEFKKHKHVTSAKSIQELVNLSNSVENEIRTTVIQAVETTPGVYTAKITPDTELGVNFPFDENVTPAQLKKMAKTPQKCCQDKS
uniref:Complex III assembly factor LYRM7 n=1 Tax=Cacopsylla melanoneura TaxID=428564 RepID=A0A8D9A3E9_9HEMI